MFIRRTNTVQIVRNDVFKRKEKQFLAEVPEHGFSGSRTMKKMLISDEPSSERVEDRAKRNLIS